VTAAIVTVTLNPTIEGASEADEIRPTRKIRTSEEIYDAGGGGINVARVVCELGGSATAVYLSGGATGAVLDELLARTAVTGHRIGVRGRTRIAHSVLERSSGLEYRFVPQGPQVDPDEWALCRSALDELPWDYLVASGSLPRLAPVDAYAELADLARRRGARLVLDTSGEALKAALERGVFLVKPSLDELEWLVGHALEDDQRRLEAARQLVDKGQAEIVALSKGQAGALLVTRDLSLHLAPPPVEARSAVGAGDSFVGGMTLALARDWPLRSAFAYGVAAGTAAVLWPGHGLVRRPDVERLYEALKTTVD